MRKNTDQYNSEYGHFYSLLIIESISFTLSQSDFLMKMNGQTKRDRQINKAIGGTDKETHNVFTEFAARYKLVHR